MTFSLACSLVLGGVSVLSVASCDKDGEMSNVPETPRAQLVDGKWQTPAATPHAILSDASVTRVNEDYFNGKLPEDATSVIGGFVTPTGLKVEGKAVGNETRLACTVTGDTLSLAKVTPKDSTFYEVNAAYGWNKEVKYAKFEYPKSAVVRGLSSVKLEGVDAEGKAHDVSAHAWLVTTTPQELLQNAQGKQPRPAAFVVALHQPRRLQVDGCSLHPRLAHRRSQELSDRESHFGAQRRQRRRKRLEAWLNAPLALPPTAVALSERRLFVCPASGMMSSCAVGLSPPH